MSYVITFVREPGSEPRALMNYQMNEKQARAYCTGFAKVMRRVALHKLDEDGFVSILARWEDGHGKRTVGMTTTVPAMVDDAPLDPEAVAVAAAEVDETEMEIQAAVAADESQRYTAQCMKCREKREFVGRVVEMANGSHAAKGNCPVCGTGMFRMVARTTPLTPDWEDDPEVTSEVEAEAEAQEDAEPETPAIPVVEFSEAEPAKPRKRTRKATAASTEGAEVARVAALKVALCPHCERKVPVTQKGGLDIFMPHPNAAKNLDECNGSGKVV